LCRQSTTGYVECLLGSGKRVKAAAKAASARYSMVMSSQTAQLLEAFESLPEEEKRAFTVEFLRRVVPFDSGPLDDSETAAAADQLFDELDAEEHGSTSR